jgi:hypothetical protein
VGDEHEVVEPVDGSLAVETMDRVCDVDGLADFPGELID